MGSLTITKEALIRLLALASASPLPKPVVHLGLRSEAEYTSADFGTADAFHEMTASRFLLVPYVLSMDAMKHLRPIRVDGIFVAFPAGPIRLMLGLYLWERYTVDFVDSQFLLRNAAGKIILPSQRKPAGA